MAELLSLGLDVGTTTTSLVISRLTVQNSAQGSAVPRMEIIRRQLLHQSPVFPTPMAGPDRVDGAAIAVLVDGQYSAAGVRREQVDTGAVIITGETSRKENAAQVLQALRAHAGSFVVATAGPHLESVLAAKGSGALARSLEAPGQWVHMDIGGGTANLALLEKGRVLATGCVNVGGRLLAFDPEGSVTYVSPVLQPLTQLRVGQRATREQALEVAKLLTRALEMAVGLRPDDGLLQALWTKEAGSPWAIPGPCGLSFSGGVADCIEIARPWLEFGDLGPLLGRAIRESRLCGGRWQLGHTTIRATVVGAGSHSTQLSGSTVYCREVALPLRDLEAVCLTLQEQALPPEALAQVIQSRFGPLDGPGVLALPGWNAPDYQTLCRLARGIALGMAHRPRYIALEADMAKALGQALWLEDGQPCLCLDGVALRPQDYLDVGKAVGPAISLVIKTLILSH